MRRKQIRLPQCEYLAGYYFVTICVYQHAELLGNIENGEIHLNDPGRMIDKTWHELPNKYNYVKLDEYVIMPDHMHGIVILNGDDGTVNSMDECVDTGAHIGAPLHTMVQWFKTMTTNQYIRGVKHDNWQPFKRHLWQRSFHDHVIRNDKELQIFREYIDSNPAAWAEGRHKDDANTSPELKSLRGFLRGIDTTVEREKDRFVG